MNLKDLPAPSILDGYLAAIEAHPFAALLIALVVIAGIWAWRKPGAK
jgi:hypothetical protein